MQTRKMPAGTKAGGSHLKGEPLFNIEEAISDGFYLSYFNAAAEETAISVGRRNWAPLPVALGIFSPSHHWVLQNYSRLLSYGEDDLLADWLAANGEFLRMFYEAAEESNDQIRLTVAGHEDMNLDIITDDQVPGLVCIYNRFEVLRRDYIRFLAKSRPAPADDLMVLACSQYSVRLGHMKVLSDLESIQNDIEKMAHEMALQWLKYRGFVVDENRLEVQIKGYQPLVLIQGPL